MNQCFGKIHVFDTGSRKCQCGKADMWWYPCPYCKKKNVAKYQGIPCTDCLVNPHYLKNMENQDKQRQSAPFVKRYKEATAFGYDRKTGQPIALDTKGKRIDPSQTRYDFKKDPHGWKATGKKVRATDRFGRPTNI